ncbi:hypothetical protein CcaCcLH18_06398 [Colletotrichum camelliae]|nr:hypothetical protein CcaCcLH18_06398 [Colletotrichum camelliae]
MPGVLNGHANGSATAQGQHPGSERTPRKLVLCFDGTGNTFTGTNADTNVVKILSKLDRNDPDQYHYYQTGIGTYDINEKSVNKTWFGEMQSSISQTVDQGIGNTFDAHVMAGYRFLMRYYDSGDKIYMFGFSRGAFTAKFLARMISTVGLLCKGNEEMVPFAYRLYQRYLAGEVEDFITSHPKKKNREKAAKKAEKKAAKKAAALAAANGNGNGNGHSNGNGNGHSETQPLLDDMEPDVEPHDHQEGEDPAIHGHNFEVAADEIAAFSDTFCRKEVSSHCDTDQKEGKESNIKVHFLGIWDCVNSVAILERKAPIPVPVVGTAHHVRHAVAVDERRVKFKAALMAQDMKKGEEIHEDILEVWFPGCHGDVGGGWPASDKNPLEGGQAEMTWWETIKNFFSTRKPPKGKAIGCDRLQLSDVALAWMIGEVEEVGKKHPEAALKWREDKLKHFKDKYADKKHKAMKAPIHDSLAFNTGTGFFTVLLWKLMEWLPFIKRWELEDGQWENVRFPLNKGETRDIPKDAVLHESLLYRLKKVNDYCPPNNHGGVLPACLKHHPSGTIAECDPPHDHSQVHKDCSHRTFTILKSVDSMDLK